MKIVVIIIGSVLGVLVTWLIAHLIRFLESRSQSIDQDIKIKSQQEVFEWGLKVVQVIEEEYRNSTLKKEVKSQQKYDQALSRLNDIMMLNGINPAQYKTEGIITYSLYIINNKRG